MADRFIIRIGAGSDKFDVLEGVKVNREPLTRAEADRLARLDLAPASGAGKTRAAREWMRKAGSPAVPAPLPEPSPPVSATAPAATEPPAPEPESSPAPVTPDLSVPRWANAGGSAGFRIKGGPTW